jgi:hypothetical protein
VLGILCMPIFLLSGRNAVVFTTLYTLVVVAYYVMACRGFFHTSFSTALWRGTTTTVLAYLVYYVALIVVVLGLVRLLTFAGLGPQA